MTSHFARSFQSFPKSHHKEKHLARVISLVFLTFGCRVGFSKSINFNLLDVQIPRQEIQVLYDLKNISDPNLILEHLSHALPQLRFIILDVPVRYSPKGLHSVYWRDSRVTRRQSEFYKNLFQTDRVHSGGSSVGTFIPAFRRLEESKAKSRYRLLGRRPLRSHPVVVLRAQTAKDIIFHEVLHYLIDRARLMKLRPQLPARTAYADWNQQLLETLRIRFYENDPAQAESDDLNFQIGIKRLESLRNSLGEEIEVVLFLLRHRTELGISDTEIAHQLLYGESNLAQLELVSDGLFGNSQEQATIPSQNRNDYEALKRNLISWFDQAADYFNRQSQLWEQLHEPYYEGQSNACQTLF